MAVPLGHGTLQFTEPSHAPEGEGPTNTHLCFVAEAMVGRGGGSNEKGSFKLGPFKKGFRWTHILSSLHGYP